MERHSHLTNQALVMASLNSYDNLGRVVFMQHYTGVSFAMYTSAFDAAGRMTSSGRTTAGAMPASESVSYVHDATGELTSLTRNGVPTSYGYDATGNRSYGGYGIGPNNRITTDGTYSYTYDNEGNITIKQKISTPSEATYYAYDHRNRLVAFSEFGPYAKNVLYEYDVFNRRVVKSIDKDGYASGYGYVPTHFVYDTDDIALALKANGDLANRYLHGPAVDEILADENEYGGVLWALRDQFYSVRDLVDHAGGHYNHIDYDAFGNVNGEMKLASQGHLAHLYGFQSRERDQESLLNYHRNRYYDAQIGRWRSEDPIGYAAGDQNLNRFVGNSPINGIDPNGLRERITLGGDRVVDGHVVERGPRNRSMPVASICQPGWASGAHWKIRNTRVSNLTTWGEMTDDRNKFWTARGGAEYTIDTDVKFRDCLVCCRNGTATRIKVDVDVHLTVHVRHIISYRYERLAYLPPWQWRLFWNSNQVLDWLAAIQNKLDVIESALKLTPSSVCALRADKILNGITLRGKVHGSYYSSEKPAAYQRYNEIEWPDFSLPSWDSGGISK